MWQIVSERFIVLKNDTAEKRLTASSKGAWWTEGVKQQGANAPKFENIGAIAPKFEKYGAEAPNSEKGVTYRRVSSSSRGCVGFQSPPEVVAAAA
jgi:hypothetical protein